MSTANPPPAPPPPMPVNYGGDWRNNPVNQQRHHENPPSKEQIEKSQYAKLPDKLLTTLNRDKKPFTYTPQGISSEKGVLDMSEIRSPRMKKRLLANLHAGEDDVTTDDDSRPNSSMSAQAPKPAPANIYQQPMAPCVLPPLENVKLRPTSPAFVPSQQQPQKKEVRFAPSPIMFSDDEELTNILEKRRKDVESRAKICTNQPDTAEDQSDFVECSNEKLLQDATTVMNSAKSLFGMMPDVNSVTDEGHEKFGKSASLFALDANNNPVRSEEVEDEQNELVPNSGDANGAMLYESPHYYTHNGIGSLQQKQQQQQQQPQRQQPPQPQQHHLQQQQEYSSAFVQPPTQRFEQLSLGDERSAFASPLVTQQHTASEQQSSNNFHPEMSVQVHHYHHQHPVQQNYQQQTMPLRPQQANAFQHLLDDLQDEINEFEQMSREAMSPEPSARMQQHTRMQSLPPDNRFNSNYNPQPKPFYASVNAPQMNPSPIHHRSVPSPVPFNSAPSPIQPDPDCIDSERMIPVSQQIAERELLAQKCSNQKLRLNDRYINPCTRLIPRRSLLETPRLPEHHPPPSSIGGAKSYEDHESGRTFLPGLEIFSQLPPGVQPPELHSPQTPPTPSKMYYGSLPRKVKLGSGGRITPDGNKSKTLVDNGRPFLPEAGMFSQLPANQPVKQQPQQMNRQSNQQTMANSHYHNQQATPRMSSQSQQYNSQPQFTQQTTTTVNKMTTFQTAPVPQPKPSLNMNTTMMSPQHYQQQQYQNDYEENRGHHYNEVDAPRKLLSNGMFSQLPANNRAPARHSSVPPSNNWAPQADVWTPPATPSVPPPINTVEYQKSQPKLTPQQVRRLPPSERPPEPNPMKYTGSHNPSRSFRLLQLMTGEDIQNHYAEEQPTQNSMNRPQSSQSYFQQSNPTTNEQPQQQQQAQQQPQPQAVCVSSDYGTDF